MPANRLQLQNALHQPYDRLLFAKEVLSPIFGTSFTFYANVIEGVLSPTKSESSVISKVGVYGNIQLEDGTEITCYEIILQSNVKIGQSKVAIQQYVRKLLASGQAALINFVAPIDKKVWRLTLIARDSILTDEGIKEKVTNSKRYTYLLGPSETCRTAAERFEELSIGTKIDFDSLVKAFSVEKLSKAFFDEYTMHYKRFVEYLASSNYKIYAFKNDDKSIRDFTKKLLGRIVFLYFVQKKGWLGASSKAYTDGDTNFIFTLFKKSGGDGTFYPNWLTTLFFETLNQDETQNSKRVEDDFTMPDGNALKIPFLNGGLFDKDIHDENLFAFNPVLFHNADNEDDPKHRGFLDFLNAFNFTVFEDSPDDHTIAVDPEMLGHIFENLLEDNKDKGAFYTPKEIVHYMCQESLIEYLADNLSKEYIVYRHIGNSEVELFGNETRKGQLKMVEALGNKALNRDDVAFIVKYKDISKLTVEQLNRMGELLETIKICDPAIGSGAFPMGLLQEIYTIKELIAYETSTDWKPSEVKENIIQKSIYGVDIEKGAVDIARLRFWLSIVVDEDKPQPLPNLDYKITVGNSLLSKFEDQVIAIDWVPDNKNTTTSIKDKVIVQRRLLKQLVNSQQQYFHAKGKDKSGIAREIIDLKCDILINQLGINGEQYKNTNPVQESLLPTAKELLKRNEYVLNLKTYENTINKLKSIKAKKEDLIFFDWKLNFPEILNEKLVEGATGFDIVIANPPYIQLQSMKQETDLLQNAKFKTFERTGDIYCLFYEVAFKILKQAGVLTYITSNKWMRSAYGEALRRFFLKETDPIVLIDFGGYQVFDTATVDTNILISKKQEYQGITKTCLLNKTLKSLNKMSDFIRQFSIIDSDFKIDESWIILTKAESGIKRKIEAIGRPLKDWDINIYRGILTGFNEAFIIDEKVRKSLIELSSKNAEIIRPILRGKHIKKYSNNQSDSIIFIPCGWTNNNRGRLDPEIYFRNSYPAIYDHLITRSKIQTKGKGLFDRDDKGDYWWELRPCSYVNEFSKEKIIYIDIMTDNEDDGYLFPCFSYSTNGELILNTAYFISGKRNDLMYIMAILNSKVGRFIVKNHVTQLQQRQYRLFQQNVETFPIPKISPIIQTEIVSMVEEIIQMKRDSLDISKIESTMNTAIYALYNFLDEEIEVLTQKS